MINKTLKKAVALASAVITMLSAASCGAKEEVKKDANITIASAISAVNVLSDKRSADLGAGKYEVTVARNEYESGQIIVTPDAEVKAYTFDVADLSDADGNKLPKENFEVYHEKYINVSTGSEGGTTGIGEYADAILPFEKAVEYRENKIAKNKNQGILITAHPSKTQKAGVYSGTFTLTADGKKHEIPASVTVLDYTLPDKVSSRSIAVMSRHYMTQTDDRISTFKNYYDYLLKYRLNGNFLPTVYTDYDLLIESALEYVDDPRVNTYCLPYSVVYNSAIGDDDVDFVALGDLLKRLYAKSVESGKNLIAKAALYYATLVDEAEIAGLVPRAVRIANDTETLKQTVVDYILANGSDEFHVSLANSVKYLPVIYTDRYFERLWNNGNGVKNFCPMVNYFSSESERDTYRKLGEQGYEYWWYTATGPHNPTPNWHIDSNPIGMRMIAWMQKEYGVSGFLYWDLICWRSQIAADGNGNVDPFEKPALYGMVENGDGVLLYPGTDYGLDVPIGSMRLERIRDGQEEYEMLNEICEVTSALDPNANADTGILKLLYDKLYADAKIRASSADFMKVRSELNDLAVFAQKFGGAVTETNVSGSTYTFTIKAPEGVEIEVGGVRQERKDGKFTIKVELSGSSNYLKFTAIKGNERNDVKVSLGGQILSLNPIETDADVAEFTTNNGTVSLDKKASFSFGLRDGAFVKIALGEALKSRQLFVFKSDKLRLLTENTLNVSMMVYSLETKAYTIEVSAKIEGEPIMESVGSFEVLPKSGKLITLSGFADLNWERCSGKITALYFYVGERGDAARTLYLDDIVYKNR